MLGTPRTNVIAALGSIVLLSACAGLGPMKKVQLSPEGAKVVLSSDAPASECNRVGLVSYSFFKGTFFKCDFVDAENTMKNEAVKLGGNYVPVLPRYRWTWLSARITSRAAAGIAARSTARIAAAVGPAARSASVLV